MSSSPKRTVGATLAATSLATIITPTLAHATPNTPTPEVTGTLALKISSLSTSLATHTQKVGTFSHKVATTTPNITYVVKRGDSLWVIAQRFGVSVNSLRSANNISANNNLIYPGQRLIIPSKVAASAPNKSVPSPAPTPTPTPAPTSAQPAPTSTNTRYVVQRGDSLWKISRQFNITVSTLVAYNKISATGFIYPGQVLLIPGNTPAPTPTPAISNTPSPTTTPTTPTTTTSEVVHIVKRGDTLGAIARAYNTTVAHLASLNKIPNPSLIYVGQRIVITPGSSTATEKPVQLVPNTFLGYTYDDETVAAANANKHALNATAVPSRAEVQKMVAQTARDMGVDPRLALAHAYVESGFDATAVSPANAIGVMQVIPTSGQWAGNMVGRSLDLLKVEDNIVAGVAIIRWLHQNASDFDQAIAGYYQGLNGVRRNGMRPDTVRYVEKVKAAMARF